MPFVRIRCGSVVQVDSEDVDLLLRFVWRVGSHGYVQRRVRVGKKVYALFLHSEIMGGGTALCDHVNRDRLDNRRKNLRKATHSQNAANRAKAQKLCATSQYKGVSWRKRTKRWKAQIQANEKYFWIGEFDSEEEAALAYNKKAQELFGEFAYLNEVPRAIARTILGA